MLKYCISHWYTVAVDLVLDFTWVFFIKSYLFKYKFRIKHESINWMAHFAKSKLFNSVVQ